MAQVTVSPEGEVLVVAPEAGGIAFRSPEGVWSTKAPAGLKVEDISSWRLAKADEAKALLIEAATVLENNLISQLEFSPLQNAIAEYSTRFGLVPPGAVRWTSPDLLLKKLQQALREGKPVEEFKKYPDDPLMNP